MNDKLDLQSTDITSLNIEKIGVLFPNCVTETAEGKKIDFDLLKQELSTEIIEGNKERYRLEWPGKREAIVTANIPTNKTLRPVREDSVDFDTTENIYIEGDNLEVLKLLQESYLSKIKMIYIDPPYNTGKDFIYKDNFTKASDEELFESGQKDEYNQKLVANPETNGRYHSDWLSMMYPRLKLARNLLTEDGVIFISIDDNEVHNLRKICDEIFGKGNFVSELIWAAGRKNDSKYISISHEYILCYVKNFEYLKENKIIWRERKEGLDDIYKQEKYLRANFVNDYEQMTKNLKDWYKNLPNGHSAKDHKHYNRIDAIGIYFPSDISWPGGGGPKYDLINPENGILAKSPSRGWLTKPETMKIWIEEGKVDFGEPGSVPCLKSYLKDREQSVPYSVFYQDGRASSKRLMNIFGSKIFENPKDENIIARLIKLSGNDSKDIILDFFSGSATTAHATMQLNAEDDGNRKYIMVQLPEATNEKNEAYKAGYKNICEIGKERICRAANKIKEEKREKAKKDGLFADFKDEQDYGFRVYRLDSSNMQDVYYKPQDYNQGKLDLFTDNVKEDRTAEDLVTQIMLDWGLPLSLPVERKTIAGKEVYAVAGDSLYCCFGKDIDETFAKAIAAEKPFRIVFRDNGFKDDTAKENVKQLLKQLSPESEMKVI